MPSKRLSVVTFNLHKGMSPFNRRSHMQEIASALQQLSADVLFLQEVQGRHAGREQHQPGWPQHDFLAAALTHSASYGMNVRYDHGHHGNAVLSRFPQQLAANHDISVNRLERRGILHTVIQPEGWPQAVACLCAHLNLLARDRRRQYLTLQHYIQHHIPAGMPLILAGDFNDWRGEADSWLGRGCGLQEVFVQQQGQHARSFPARLPLLPLDRIYVRGLRVHQVAVCRGQPWSHLSDHLPLFASLSLAS
ncbi:endonuclease/exonuclease/phosphatase family protein [Vogesella indigofera]|uniref:endonuclease/exonuclease/phosphatase family protein n=1 Tax=Vogesella indigofera TaxID=45465 RepID=UPI00234E3227|nr:endonuclease/exonuclease/phosphatase family protein [Vogesella indigofera]MDC7704980.1 endonuclease/exonuclease/phosphatase family protein [Vogesella indigofera]